MPLIAELFLTFAKIGLFTFGGGYAMISLIEDTCVESKKWITHEDMMNITVIAESTPGPIAVNCATFVGSKQAGFRGALAATLGVILPSFVIIYVISLFLDRFLEITLVANAFRGIKVAVGLLILRSGVGMLRKMPKKPLAIGIFCVSCAGMLILSLLARHVSTVAMLLAAGVLSLSVCLLGRKKGGQTP